MREEEEPNILDEEEVMIRGPSDKRVEKQSSTPLVQVNASFKEDPSMSDDYE